jgi:Cation efflux system protein CusB domain 1
MAMSLVDAESFWIDGYFEETALKRIREGDPAKIWLLGYGKVLQGHVDSVSRGIVVSNATPGQSGLANVNPVFTWVRLAQRIPVRIQIDQLPADVRLVVGMTATVEVEPGAASPRPPQKVRGPPRHQGPSPGRRWRKPTRHRPGEYSRARRRALSRSFFCFSQRASSACERFSAAARSSESRSKNHQCMSKTPEPHLM